MTILREYLSVYQEGRKSDTSVNILKDDIPASKKIYT